MGPRSMTTSDSVYDDDRPRLHHRKSAKVLINQYEENMRGESHSTRRRTSPAAAYLSAAPVPRTATAVHATGSASFYPPGTRRNGGNNNVPLRNSFKNLLSLLKKGKTGLIGGNSDKDKAVFPPTAKTLRTSAAALLEEQQRVKELPLLPLPLGDAQRPVLSRSQTQMGTLIYLTSSSFEPTIPVWTSSTITLQGSKITVSWFTPEGMACAHEISLLGCSNIRSVSDLRTLGSKEREALPNEGGEELKIFELLFKDRRQTERFAVVSVRERAKWISAFWDAILPSGTDPGNGVQGAITKGVERVDELRPPYQSTSYSSSTSSHSPTKATQSRPLPSRTNTDRSLPPIPISRTLSRRTNDRPTIAPLSIPSKPGASSNPMDMSRTNTTMSTTTVLLLQSPPPKLPMPISPASAYSTASAIPSHLQSPSRSRSAFKPHSPTPVRGSPSGPTKHSGWPPGSGLPLNGGGSNLSATSSVASAPSLVRRANSPSITNLSKLSVVKGRLAQLERSGSQHASGGGAQAPLIMNTGSSGGLRSVRLYLSGGDDSVRVGDDSTGGDSDHFDQKLVGRGIGDPNLPAGSGATQAKAKVPEVLSKQTGEEDEGPTAADASTRSVSSSNTVEYDSLLKHVKAADGLPMPSSAPDLTSASPEKSTVGGGDSARDVLSPETRGLDAQRILDDIASIRSILGGSEASRAGSSDDGPTIHQVALGLDHRLKGAHETLKEVKSTLRGIEKLLEKGHNPTSDSHGQTTLSTDQHKEKEQGDREVLKVLKGVGAQLAANLPGLEAKITEIGRSQERFLAEQRGVPPPPSLSAPLDLGPVQKQLDDLIKLSSSTKAVMKAGTISRDVLSEITHLTSLMEGDRAHREQQLLQQADSVRYLNELNAWLEAFVNNGTSHIQGLAASIDKLCVDLGSTALTASNSSSGAPKSASLPPTSLLNDVRQLVLGMKARDQNMASLQAAVNDLIVTVGSETRPGVDSQALAHMMESQKRNQESMLKVFTDEISGEIKGERLRFVEAMKEATAINVQLHVEQLKNEMGKEVFVMAKEVERLHRDKQEVEQRIAELMAFYSNQAPMAATADSRPQFNHPMKPVADLRMRPLSNGSGSDRPSSRSHRRQTLNHPPAQALARQPPLPRRTF